MLQRCRFGSAYHHRHEEQKHIYQNSFHLSLLFNCRLDFRYRIDTLFINIIHIGRCLWRVLSLLASLNNRNDAIRLRLNTSASKFLIKIAPYGKMSLTNYLSQSIIGGFVFYNWGLGMFRYSGHASSLLLGMLCVALQYAFCRWWLSHFSHGPFEMIWRKLTWIGKR